jgi:hypothetical protein
MRSKMISLMIWRVVVVMGGKLFVEVNGRRIGTGLGVQFVVYVGLQGENMSGAHWKHWACCRERSYAPSSGIPMAEALINSYVGVHDD